MNGNGTAPDYIQSLVQPYTPTRHLRSSLDNSLVVPPLKSARSQPKLFSCLAPQWWNHLPTSIRDTDCLSTFKESLKMHLFREYNGTLLNLLKDLLDQLFISSRNTITLIEGLAALVG